MNDCSACLFSVTLTTRASVAVRIDGFSAQSGITRFAWPFIDSTDAETEGLISEICTFAETICFAAMRATFGNHLLCCICAAKTKKKNGS